MLSAGEGFASTKQMWQGRGWSSESKDTTDVRGMLISQLTTLFSILCNFSKFSATFRNTLQSSATSQIRDLLKPEGTLNSRRGVSHPAFFSSQELLLGCGPDPLGVGRK